MSGSTLSVIFTLFSQMIYVSDLKTKTEGSVHYSIYKGESIRSQPIPFPMGRDVHDFHALFTRLLL